MQGERDLPAGNPLLSEILGTDQAVRRFFGKTRDQAYLDSTAQRIRVLEPQNANLFVRDVLDGLRKDDRFWDQDRRDASFELLSYVNWSTVDQNFVDESYSSSIRKLDVLADPEGPVLHMLNAGSFIIDRLTDPKVRGDIAEEALRVRPYPGASGEEIENVKQEIRGKVNEILDARETADAETSELIFEPFEDALRRIKQEAEDMKTPHGRARRYFELTHQAEEEQKLEADRAADTAAETVRGYVRGGMYSLEQDLEKAQTQERVVVSEDRLRMAEARFIQLSSMIATAEDPLEKVFLTSPKVLAVLTSANPETLLTAEEAMFLLRGLRRSGRSLDFVCIGQFDEDEYLESSTSYEDGDSEFEKRDRFGNHRRSNAFLNVEAGEENIPFMPSDVAVEKFGVNLLDPARGYLYDNGVSRGFHVNYSTQVLDLSVFDAVRPERTPDTNRSMLEEYLGSYLYEPNLSVEGRSLLLALNERANVFNELMQIRQGFTDEDFVKGLVRKIGFEI